MSEDRNSERKQKLWPLCGELDTDLAQAVGPFAADVTELGAEALPKLSQGWDMLDPCTPPCDPPSTKIPPRLGGPQQTCGPWRFFRLSGNPFFLSNSK